MKPALVIAVAIILAAAILGGILGFSWRYTLSTSGAPMTYVLDRMTGECWVIYRKERHRVENSQRPKARDKTVSDDPGIKTFGEMIEELDAREAAEPTPQ